MENQNEVIIADIKMPFGSMVAFMVKAAIASIPAVIILTIIYGIVAFMMAGIFSGMSGY